MQTDINVDRVKEGIRELNNQFRNKIVCSNRCHFYYFCPESHRKTHKDPDNKLCKAAYWDEKKKRRFIRIFMLGDEGAYLEARETLFNLAETLNLDDDPKEMEKYIDLCLKMGRAIKSDRERFEKPGPLTIDVSSIEVGSSPKLQSPDTTSILEEDAESLLSSDIIEELIKRKKPNGEVRDKITPQTD